MLFMCNAWKTLEKQNRHCTEFLMRTEIEVIHALHGKIQSGELFEAIERKQWKNIIFGMLVTEWTRVLCCSGLAQREIGRFRLSS